MVSTLPFANAAAITSIWIVGAVSVRSPQAIYPATEGANFAPRHRCERIAWII